MQRNETFSDIITTIITKDDRDNIIVSLEKLSGRAEMNGFISLQDISDIQFSLYNFLKDLANDGKIELLILKDLLEKIKDIEVVRIILAFNPSMKFVSELKNDIEKLLNKNILIDININKEIIGGIIIDYNGKYTDISLAKELKEMFQKKKENILKMIK